MAEFDQGKGMQVLAPLAWRAAEKFFKLISWTAIVVALRLAAAKTGSHSVGALATLATVVLSITLALQAFYLAVRDPAGFGVPAAFHRPARAVQFALALALMLAIGGPPLFLDQVIDALGNARLN